MTSFKMATKERVGKTELCFVLPILDRILQKKKKYFIHFRCHGFRICIDNKHKATVNVSKDHNISILSRFSYALKH